MTRITIPAITATLSSFLLIVNTAVLPLASVILYERKSLPMFHLMLLSVFRLTFPRAVFSATKIPRTRTITQISTSIFRMCHTNLPTNALLIRLPIEYIFLALLGWLFALDCSLSLLFALFPLLILDDISHSSDCRNKLNSECIIYLSANITHIYIYNISLP